MTAYTLQQVRVWINDPEMIAAIDAAIAEIAELRADNSMLRKHIERLTNRSSSATELSMAKQIGDGLDYARKLEQRIAELERELAAWKRAVHQECGTTFVIQADGCERTSESRITARVAELLAAPAAAQEGTNA